MPRRKKNEEPLTENNEDVDDDKWVYIPYHNPFKRMPAGCRACGNPAYPDCKISCPLFDD